PIGVHVVRRSLDRPIGMDDDLVGRTSRLVRPGRAFDTDDEVVAARGRRGVAWRAHCIPPLGVRRGREVRRKDRQRVLVGVGGGFIRASVTGIYTDYGSGLCTIR